MAKTSRDDSQHISSAALCTPGLNVHFEDLFQTPTDDLSVGYIPMRQLVYRVQALPQSILPLVWDFGQLTIEVEQLYIKQMVHRCVCIRLYLVFSVTQLSVFEITQCREVNST